MEYYTDNVNISQWYPGENWDDTAEKYTIAPQTYEVKRTLTLDKNLAADEYIIAIAVLDPAGMVPSLRFATKIISREVFIQWDI